MSETRKPILDQEKKEILRKVLEGTEVTDEELDAVSGGSCNVACQPGCLLSDVKPSTVVGFSEPAIER